MGNNILTELGRIPPQAVEAEEHVLGAILCDNKVIFNVADFLKPDHFYKESNRIIYQSILALYQKNSPVEIISLTNYLRSEGQLELIGGAFVLAELTNKIATTANLEYYGRIITQKHLGRKLIEVSSNIQRDAFEETTDVFDLLIDSQKQLMDASNELFTGADQHIKDIAESAYTEVIKIDHNEIKMLGISSGIWHLDTFLGGFRKTKTYIIGGRPGMGKTSLALSILLNVAVEQKIPVSIFSLEMGKEELCYSLFSQQSGLENNRIERNYLDAVERDILAKSVTKIQRSPIYIDDTPGMNIIELRSKCMRQKSVYNIGLFIIDYLQLMKGTDKRMKDIERVNEISRELKLIAKETNTPVIALSQLSRGVESRTNKRPLLSDLRESGNIEQDADAVLFPYRPHYYDQGEDSELVEINIAKHRGGALGTAYCKFNAPTTKFYNK